MSDYDDEYMCNEDEDYDLEYSEDSNSEPDVDLENQYYNSKALKDENPKAALESFQRVLELEKGDKGEWGFKALKQGKWQKNLQFFSSIHAFNFSFKYNIADDKNKLQSSKLWWNDVAVQAATDLH